MFEQKADIASMALDPVVLAGLAAIAHAAVFHLGFLIVVTFIRSEAAMRLTRRRRRTCRPCIAACGFGFV